MLALYIVLGILLLPVVLACFPVSFRLGFQQEFSLELRYLFWRIPLLPGQESPEEEGPPEEEKPEEEPPEKKPSGAADRMKQALKREGLGGFLQTLGELVQLAGQATAGVLRGLRLREFDLYLCLPGAGDAAAAALLYGKASAGVYALYGVLLGLLPCKKTGVTVDLDYDGAESRICFTAELSIRPIRVLREALWLLLKSLRPLKRLLGKHG